MHEALVSDAAIERGAVVYRAEDVDCWIKQLTQNQRLILTGL
jgi:hypothetical protein